MSADGSIELDWAGGRYKFRLAIGELRQLQEAVNKVRIAQGAEPVGPRSLMRAFLNGTDWADDTREVIRIGLIGGGESANEAARLTRINVDEKPLVQNAQTAIAILLAALVGVDGDDVGKAQAERAQTEQAVTTNGSPSPHSTGPALQ